MSVKQIEEAILQLPSGEFAELLTWMQGRELESERETAYLLDNPVMKQRLLEARATSESLSLAEARARLGIQSPGVQGLDVMGEFRPQKGASFAAFDRRHAHLSVRWPRQTRTA